MELFVQFQMIVGDPTMFFKVFVTLLGSDTKDETEKNKKRGPDDHEGPGSSGSGSAAASACT